MNKYFLFLIVLIFAACKNSTSNLSPAKTEADIFKIMDKNISTSQKELYFYQTKDKKYYKANEKNYYQKGWVTLKVKTNRGYTKTFAIMISPVSKKMFYGKGSDKPVTNISFEAMNDFCIKNNGFLVASYVFDEARRKKLINKPSDGINSEIIAPFDEEDDEDFLNTKDNIISKDGTIIKFDWDKEKYYEVSDNYVSKNTTFRCMKIK